MGRPRLTRFWDDERNETEKKKKDRSRRRMQSDTRARVRPPPPPRRALPSHSKRLDGRLYGGPRDQYGGGRDPDTRLAALDGRCLKRRCPTKTFSRGESCKRFRSPFNGTEAGVARPASVVCCGPDRSRQCRYHDGCYRNCYYYYYYYY